MVRKLKKENGRLYEMTRFKYRCDFCKHVIESIDNIPVFCKCGNLSILGGINYGGLIACKDDFITDVSEWKLYSNDTLTFTS
jgi:hypothetical protein